VSQDTYECAGCGEAVPVEEVGTIWCRSPLGMSVLHTHRSQDCGRAALAKRPELRMYPQNRPPGGTDEEVRARVRGRRKNPEDHVRSERSR
jgi:hypothetical protein